MLLQQLLVHFSFLFSTALSANILCVFHIPARSHFILIQALLKEITERGHNVTIISPFDPKEELKNYKTIHVETESIIRKNYFKKTDKITSFSEISYWYKPFYIEDVLFDMTEQVFKTQEVQDLLKSKDTKFDLVITQTLGNEALYGLSHHFNAPSLLFCTFGTMHWIDPLFGNSAPTSYVPCRISSYPFRRK